MHGDGKKPSLTPLLIQKWLDSWPAILTLALLYIRVI